MQKFTILVAVDFSKSSYEVLERVVDFAKKRDAQIHVVHVVEDSFFSKKQNLDEIKENGFSTLSKTFSMIERENFHCINGKVKVEVANAAKLLNADMIIMGKSGETYFLSDLLMGSHTKEIVKYAQTPILVVKSNHTLKYNNILALTDLSGDSADAIRKVAQIFPTSSINLLHLFYLPIDNRIDTYGFKKEDVIAYQASIKKKSQEDLDEFKESLNLPKEQEVTATALKSSLNPKVFKEETKDITFDLLVIHATQNVSFFAFDTLEESSTDVLIIK